jgi:D-alanyl-D-alanine carboxypeptidase
VIRLPRGIVIVALAATAGCAKAEKPDDRQATRAATLRTVIERFRAESRFPGAVVGAWFADSSSVVISVGSVDRGQKTPMPEQALLHAGSVGKTLFAAVALALVGDGRIGLDDKVARHLGSEPWYAGIPNAEAITIRMLLDHTSGIPEYGESFMRALIKEPGRVRQPLEAVQSVVGAKPAFPAGERFGYSDVNYQLLQLLLERVLGGPATAEIQRRILEPHRLSGIIAADRKSFPGLVQAYAGKENFLGFDSLLVDDSLVFDPTFEGGGGGFIANAGDLARWIPLFAEGKVFPPSLLPEVRRGVAAGQLDVGQNASAGLGIEMAPTPLGTAYGHGGFFPGDLSLVLWYPDAGVSLAIQLNSSAPDALARPLRDVLLEAAQALTGGTDSSAAAGPDLVADPNGRYDVRVPARWAGRYRIDTLSTVERGSGLPGTLLFQYVPADSSVRPQALLVVVTYDSAAWRAARAEEGPPPGDSVASKNGKVFVIGLPQSNPFPAASPDSGVFDGLALRAAEVSGLLRVR